MPELVPIDTLIDGDVPDTDEDIFYCEFVDENGITGTITDTDPSDPNYKDRVINTLKDIKTLLALERIE